jgi:hypothetical protein
MNGSVPQRNVEPELPVGVAQMRRTLVVSIGRDAILERDGCWHQWFSVLM